MLNLKLARTRHACSSEGDQKTVKLKDGTVKVIWLFSFQQGVPTLPRSRMQLLLEHVFLFGMKVIRHAVVDSRMIILDDQARQQMTLHFQLSLQCNVSPITGFVRHTGCMSSSLMLGTSFPSEGGRRNWGSTSYRTTCRTTGSCEGKKRMNIHILLEHYVHYTLKLSIKWSKWSACMCMGRLIYKQWFPHG